MTSAGTPSIVDDGVNSPFRGGAKDNGRSIAGEEHIRNNRAVQKAASNNLADLIREHFGPSNGVDLELPPREPAREPPTFD